MKVLIAGGGIAGPAAATALAKAGITSEVFEAYPDGAADATGAFLTLATNGMDALNAIGACDLVLDASFAATRLRIFRPAGSQAADAPLGCDHPCSRTITRAALSGILRDQALRRGVPVRQGKRLATAATSPDGQVTAVFTDGTEATGDLLIGADGFYSPCAP